LPRITAIGNLGSNWMSNTEPSAGDHADRPRRGWAVDWRQVGILYSREFRSALRDRSVVINSILIPVLLYPFLMWIGLSAVMFVRGQSDAAVARVVVAGLPREHPGLRLEFEKDDKLAIEYSARPPDLKGAASRIRAGKVDAFLEFTPTNAPPNASIVPLVARITYDQTIGRSAGAHGRLVALLEKYREKWIKSEARRRGIDAAKWQGFGILAENTASSTQMGGFVLALVLPSMFAVMVASGCFFPAVDTLAGERERGTWETLMSTSAQRGAVLVAKYLHVVTFGGLAGILNILAIAFTIKPLLRAISSQAGGLIELSTAWRALPMMVVAALLLAGFIGAGMMVFAAFARTFKEGQASISAFYLVVIVPVVFLQVPGLRLTESTALVPVANMVLMIREAVGGQLRPLPAVIAILASLSVIGVVLSVAAYVLKSEEVAAGSYSGSVMKFLWSRLRGRVRPVEGAP